MYQKWWSSVMANSNSVITSDTKRRKVRKGRPVISDGIQPKDTTDKCDVRVYGAPMEAGAASHPSVLIGRPFASRSIP